MLVHFGRLLSLSNHEEIVCHSAGVLRNLAAENQSKVWEWRGQGRDEGVRVMGGGLRVMEW